MNFAKGTNTNSSDREILLNAGILAGWTFFSSLVGLNVATGATIIAQTLVGAAIAAALAFFSYLAVARGVKKPKPDQIEG
jgi:hypothetical protein